MTPPPGLSPLARALLLLGIFVIAGSLRAPITAVAPLLSQLREAFHLSPAEAGMLTTLPLFAFGILSPFAVMLAREYGLERSLFMALTLLVGGIALRSSGPEWALFVGTFLIGASIAVGNVLLPSLVKRDFPQKVPAITGFVVIAMSAVAALTSSVAVPLAAAVQWQIALGSVALAPIAALMIWSAQLGGHTAPARGTATPPHGGTVWRSALAWQVTLFMAINSFLFYVMIAWLPAILTASGYSASAAGTIHGVMQLASAAPGFVLGAIIARMKDQRLPSAMSGLLLAVSLAGLWLLPTWATLWSALFGFGSGASMLLALMFMGLRAGNASQTAALSGMAQCVGYLLASTGPTLAGLLHDRLGSWSAPLGIGILLSGGLAIFGLLAGRTRVIDTPGHRRGEPEAA